MFEVSQGAHDLTKSWTPSGKDSLENSRGGLENKKLAICRMEAICWSLSQTCYMCSLEYQMCC